MGVMGTHEKICTNNPIQKCCRGQCDPVTLACMVMFLGIWVVVPMLCIYIGSTSSTGGYPCERPMLSFGVTATGYMALVHAIVVLWLSASWECKAMASCRWTAGVSVGVVTCILFVFWLMGVWQITTTNPSRCGFIIWEFGHLIWIFVPAISLVFLCCGLPCLYCSEFFHNRQVDANLMRRDEE